MPDDQRIAELPRVGGINRLLPVRAGMFVESQPPIRRWMVPNMIPAGAVTLLSGDGAVGKSLLALQLAVASVARRDWIGMTVGHGAALFVSAEDDLDELHRRIAGIARFYGIGRDNRREMDDLSVVSLAGEDAVLASPNGPSLRTTPLFAELEQHIADRAPGLVVLDTLADIFGGEENQRSHARQFIGLLRGWCTRHAVTLLVLTHPSIAGLASGTGTSGSTGWSNSVRSRLYLDRDRADDDARSLSTKKANYAKAGGTMRLEWHKGAFRLAAEAQEAQKGKKASVASPVTKQRFLDLLSAFSAEGRRVSSSPGANYAPSLFSKDARSAGASKVEMTAAMDALFAENRLRMEATGPKSRPERRLVEVKECLE